jgi:hypothetical protein
MKYKIRQKHKKNDEQLTQKNQGKHPQKIAHLKIGGGECAQISL